MLFHLTQLLRMHIGQTIGDCTKHQVTAADAIGMQSLCMLNNTSVMWGGRNARRELESGRPEAR